MSVEHEPTLARADQVVAGFRLSPPQRRLWSLGGGDAASPYRASCVVAIRGPLDVAALAAAIRGAVERHEILRTTFRSLAEVRVPLQVVGAHPPALEPVPDLGGGGAAAVAALEGSLRRQPIDVGRGPLVHCRLAALGEREWALLVALPGLCADAAGLRNLVREIAAGYGALVEGSALATEPLQYADLSEWQNGLLEGSEVEHWRRRVRGSCAPPRLPLVPAAAPGRFAPRTVAVAVGAPEGKRIEILAREHDASARAFLLACWQLLLGRLSGRSEMLLGVADDGRSYEGLDRALGPFAKHLPLVCGAKPDAPFVDLLRRAEADLADLRQWQEYYDPDAEGMVDGAEAAYLPVAFAWEEELPPLAAGGVTFAAPRVEAWIDRFDLALVGRRGEALELELHYDAAACRREDVVRLGDQLHALIGSALAAPDAAAAELSGLSAAERHRLVVEVNRTEAERLPARGVHELFARQARAMPERPAVRYEDRELTYGELAVRAHRLAHRLRRLGVGPETPVAICCERSLEVVVAILGILEAGGAYVPLDPGQPAARLAAMLEEVGAPLLLTQSRLAGILPRQGARILLLDADWEEIAGESDREPAPVGEPENLAYVIFTSGSTGRPKGVGVEHRQLLNYVAGAVAALDLADAASFATVSTFAADLGHTAVFPALCLGGCLHVVSQERLSDPEGAADYFARHPVDCLKIVPSHLEALLGCREPERVLPRRRLVLGGEACRRSVVEKVRALAPECAAFNHYGPTETTVGVLVHPLPGDGAPGGGAAGPNAPLGRPLGNTRVYVLDADLRPLPVWTPGEIYIGGAGVARGYVGRPAATAERFVPDPFSPGARLYRTGDIGRFLPDGEVEFLGRADDQVKIRGFRIEPGEVEALLRLHPAVAQAVVTAREDAPGEKRLVAYLVAAAGGPLAAPELRGWLAERLPEYMLPAAFVELESFPLGPNGKMDRAALPAPAAAAAAAAYEPPRGPVEELLAGIWAAVLGVERIGLHDHFFALGGHSLLATQMISRVRHALGREVPLRLLFEAPTLVRFADRVEALAGAGAALPPVEAMPRDGDLPLSFAQQRLWFLHQLEPGSSLYNIPAAFRLSGELDPAALARALGEIVRRHEALRTIFPAPEGRPVQRIEPPAPRPLPLADLSALPEAAREAEAFRVATAEARRPFDLAAGPLHRLALLRLAPGEHVLLATLHHIVGDGWSKGIIVRELGALYPAFAAGRPSPLPEPPLQYADFALWQRRWLASEALEAQLAFWRRQLAGAPPVLELPADRPRPAVRSHAGAHRPYALAAPLTEALRQLGRREGATLFMTLLAALQVLLARLSGQEDICVGTAVSGRNRLEIEGLIGFFVNTLVLRGDLTGEPTFVELLARVRSAVLEAYARQDLPFEKLVEELEPERSLGHNPLFQVMLVLHNAPPERLELPGLTLAAVPVTSGVSKFDLALPLLETGRGLMGALEYDAELFDEATVARWLRLYETLLGEAARQPETPIWRLSVLDGSERHQLLVEWQPAVAAQPPEIGLHELFEAQARRCAERTALIVGERSLTYGDLDARADRLARRLIAAGVGPEAVVAVALERSVESVVALLGILKAGGAYLSVDPGYPAERIAFLLRDAAAAAVVTRRELAGALPPGTAPLVFAAAGDAEAAGEDAGDPGPGAKGFAPSGRPVAGGQLAYVIYTSGSTGLPKGVGVSHAAAAAHLAAIPRAFGLSPEDRILQFSSLSFDVSLEQIFSALLLGATLVMRGEEPWGEAELVERVRGAGVTVANLPTAYWQQLAGSGAVETLGGGPLRLMIAGGEAMQPAASAAWRRAALRLINAYGPTEATITAALYEVAGELPAGRRVPIGRPTGERTAYVLDARGDLAPVGVPGELCLGGPLLARGYLGRPELTAERFVPDPFGTPGGRLYRTGDLVRLLPDGALEFLGRTDDQVKVRGFRVELGEVEAALGRCPEVREAVVVALGEGAADKRLVAYVVASPGSGLDPADLRRHLERELPEYMRPSAVTLLDALPLTPTGKIDRKALPAPRPERRGAEPADAALTPTEELVAAVWSQVLGQEDVERDASFFDLGGHSLLAVQVLSRLRELFHLELPLRRLFEAPTVAGIARAIEELRASAGEARTPALEPVPRHRPLPLSFAQQRLWFLHQLQAGSSAYHVPIAFRLAGPLDVPALKRSLGEIVRRHEVLRTAFAVESGEPIQVIAPVGPAALPRVDLAALPAEAREREAERLVLAVIRRPFDLEHGPLLRIALLRFGAEEHAVVAVAHHIVADGWSTGVLQRELAALYTAFSAGRPSPLAELPVQYADFAVWQRRWLTGEALEAEVRHWRERLAGAPALQLPLDRPRPPAETFRGGRESLRLSPRLRDACLALARREAATLFMTLLAAFDALLWRWTGTEDVPLGTPVANRDRAELEGLIGLFLNTLVLRVDLSGDPTAAELIARVREVSLEAFAHQHLPFEKLVEELQPERDLSRTPLFQVLFVLQGDPHGVLDLPGLTACLLAPRDQSAKFDLSLSLQRSIHGLIGAVDYRRDLFDPATVRRLAGHFAALLEGMTADPGRPISQLPLLASAERHQVVLEWNDTAVPRSGPALLHAPFAARAATAPEAVALVAGRRSLTYGELDELAGRLARRLRGRGVGPESRVGVFMERSVELVVALFAVLKAGGAYLPLDPEYPAERVAFMLADGGASLVLTQGVLGGRLPAHGAPTLEVDLEELRAAGPAGGAWESGASPDNIAYVIYTSGSTGRPKGVMVSHRAICNRLEWMQEAYRLTAADRVLQKTPFSFDVSVWEFFWPLSTGARLVLAPPAGHRDPAGLLALIARERITTVHFVPSMLDIFLEVPGLEAAACLQRVICSGEALGGELQERCHARLPASLHNLYGPTEAAVDVTFWACERDGPGRTVPIGWPIANTRIHLLDAGLRPVPIGAAGELHIGGVGLARGYLGRPALTAEQFVPDPFATAPGERLYKTGDLARRLPDGGIEYLGRIDHQIKVRGVRVELGEIEAVLGTHPAVRQVAVTAREDGAAGKRLVAYVVPRSGSAIAAGELRSLAREKLPEAMVPSAVVLLHALPLTPSGKLDRRALPVPAQEPGREIAPVRTPLEELIAGLWAGVLGRQGVGADESFFDLGGHSLSAAQVAARLRQALGREVPLGLLFQRTTVRGLAAALEDAEREASSTALPPITRVLRDGELPLSSPQVRLWFLEQWVPGSSALNIPRAVRFSGRLDPAALGGALAEIVRRHEVLRATFPGASGRPVQVIGPLRRDDLKLVDLAALPEGKREGEATRLAALEARRPFDLARGPLLRATLLRLGDDEHVALFTMHHIVSDGWSMGILVRELSVLYRAALAGLPSPLAELPIQYADYAVWQSRWLAGATLDAHLAFWRRQLAGATPLLLPTDRPRPAVRSLRGATRGVHFGEPLAQAVAGLARREDATRFMTLLAAFQALLGRAAGQDDVVVGADYANRDRVETEGLIGFFINQLVLAADLGGNPTFRELLARVRRSALDAYAHRELPFEKLVEALNPRRGLDQAPLFQVKLILQNAPAADLTLPGVALRVLATEPGAAQLDLTLALAETPRGLDGWINYSTDLFDAATIDRLARQLAALLERAAGDPEARLDELTRDLDASERKQLMIESKRRETNLQRFKAVQPKPVSLPAREVVRMGPLTPGQRLPLLVTPAVEDVDLAAWAAENRGLVEAKLHEHGAILFRGFGIASPAAFEHFAGTICGELFHDNGEHPRETVTGNVYTPVFYPADQRLLWHNENSFNFQWPAKILFCCAQPPESGGETPIVDSREVFAAIDPRVRERFLTRQVMYVRNFGNGLGLDWRTVFQVEDEAGLAEQCREERIGFEWREGGRLHTRSVRPAAVRHPATGEMSWFNQAQHWHVSCLDPETRRSMEALFREEDLPRNCYLGDGSPIEDGEMAEILAAYQRLEVSFPWQQGDVLLVDNVLTAHGRNPFRGERKLLVAMGEMTSFEEV